jgi:hypothetical protein
MVNWRHQVSAVVLAVLAAVPLTRTVCAAVCDAPATAVSIHHASGNHCEEASPTSDGPAIAPSAHDCSAHASITETASPPVQRTDLNATPYLLSAAIADAIRNPPASATSPIDYRSPPGSAPPTTIPLVLRL